MYKLRHWQLFNFNLFYIKHKNTSCVLFISDDMESYDKSLFEDMYNDLILTNNLHTYPEIAAKLERILNV